MNQFFSEIRNRFMRFMIGRYGVDRMSTELAVLAFVLYISNILFRSTLLNYLFLGIILYVYYRMFSKNISKRALENQTYLKKTQHIRHQLADIKEQWRVRKTHHIYKCPTCQQKIRVPRGKGRISIHCPKCHSDFIKKS